MNQRDRMLLSATEERLHRLDEQFSNAISTLYQSLERLLGSEPFTYQARPRRLPQHAVYLFSEEDRPLYVGRSHNFSQRLGNHCRNSSRANQSSFAFKLACEIAGIVQTRYSGPNKRSDLIKDQKFIQSFMAAKARLNEMSIRFVEEPDPVHQALLEIYCAVALRTPYNDFATH